VEGILGKSQIIAGWQADVLYRRPMRKECLGATVLNLALLWVVRSFAQIVEAETPSLKETTGILSPAQVAVTSTATTAAVPTFFPSLAEGEKFALDARGRLLLEERFSGPELDHLLWNTSLKVFGRWGDRYHNDSYLNYLSDDDVLLEKGGLRLRAERRSVEGDNPPGVYDYSAGMISSHDKFTFCYGYVEIRARFPGGKGVWPAFWLMPQSHQWPPEFDIAEYYAGRRMMHLGLCHGDFPEINWDSGANDDVDFEGGWNTYGLLWAPGFAAWIQNGVVKRVTRGAQVPSLPMYIILSNGVSSRVGPSGEPDGSTVFPNYFEVEYLKVWGLPGQP